MSLAGAARLTVRNGMTGKRNTTGGPMTSTSPNINRWYAFALLAVAFFMTIVDLTIVNVALPTIGRKLHFPE